MWKLDVKKKTKSRKSVARINVVSNMQTARQHSINVAIYKSVIETWYTIDVGNLGQR